MPRLCAQRLRSDRGRLPELRHLKGVVGHREEGGLGAAGYAAAGAGELEKRWIFIGFSWIFMGFRWFQVQNVQSFGGFLYARSSLLDLSSLRRSVAPEPGRQDAQILFEAVQEALRKVQPLLQVQRLKGRRAGPEVHLEALCLAGGASNGRPRRQPRGR